MQACGLNPHRLRPAAVLTTWARENPQKYSRQLVGCGSFRCAYCAERAGHVLFARFTEALGSVEPQSLVMMVLTLPGWLHRDLREGRISSDQLWQAVGRMRTKFFHSLRQYLNREYGHNWDNRMLWVFEEHASGVPHINIVFSHREFSSDLDRQAQARRLRGARQDRLYLAGGRLLGIARKSGFGWRCTAEPNRFDSGEALAGYVVKRVKSELASEVTKTSQLPHSIPKRRRRWGAGRGFVPPLLRSERMTGAMLVRLMTPEGDLRVTVIGAGEPRWLLAARNLAPDDPARVKAELRWADRAERRAAWLREAEVAAAIERVLVNEEEAHRRRFRGRLPEQIAAAEARTFVRRAGAIAELRPDGYRVILEG